MVRREFIVLAAGALLGAASRTRAQAPAKSHRIGYLSLRSAAGPLDHAFADALAQLGYVEGRNLVIDYRWAADREDRLVALATELVELKVEVIVTSATPAVSAAMRATRIIPIVVQSVADPIGNGLVSNLARPEGNVTGISLLSNDLAAKRLQLLRELVPESKRVGLLALDNAFATPLLIQALRAACRALGLDLVPGLVKNDADLQRAFAAFAKAQVQSMIVQTSPFAAARRTEIARLAALHRIPAMYEVRAYVDSGGLVAYGPDGEQMVRRSAVYVDRILRGAKPGDLPIEQPSKFELVINLKAAGDLGLSVPSSFLARADDVVR